MHHAPNTGQCQKATVSGDTNEVFSGEPRSTAQMGCILAPRCQSRCTRVAEKTNMSVQRFDRFHHGANNKHNVCRSSNVHRRHQPTTHTMTKQKQDKSHGNQGNYHNDVELQTWCTHVLATVNRNICSKLCDLHIMLFCGATTENPPTSYHLRRATFATCPQNCTMTNENVACHDGTRPPRRIETTHMSA